MMSEKRIAVVTGANRGIGLEICKQLFKSNNIFVVLTSRDEQKGKEAIEQFKQQGFSTGYHQLDVTDEKSINRLANYLSSEYGRCDILVNNAGVFPDARNAGSEDWPSIFETSLDVMRRAMDTNVYGPLMLCQRLVPLMKKNGYGRIVNLSSGMGQLSEMNGHCPAYRHSKTALNAITKIIAEELKNTNIKSNCMCPGWVKTDMGGSGATRELPEGADTAVWLATLPDDGPSGCFFRDRKEFAW